MGADGKLDLEQVIEQMPFGRFQGTVFVLCVLIALFDGYDAQIVGFVVTGLAQAWHVDRSAFGPVFSIGFAGLLVGALVLGTAADRFGRKAVLVVATAIFGLFSLATVFASSIDELLVLRFLTGFGVGGAVPNAIALIGEYAPRSRRVTLMTSVGAGVSVGAALAGLIASRVLVTYGWPALFYIGGIPPLLLVPVLVAFLPESVRFLLLRGRSPARIARIVSRIVPGAIVGTRTAFVIPERGRPGFPVAHLFRDGRGLLTTLLWSAFLLNIAVLYTLIPWLPTLVHELGLGVSEAAIVAAVFSIGGIVGGVGVGRLMDRANPYAVLVLVLLGAAASTAAIGLVGTGVLALSMATFAAGFCVAGGQHGANAHAGQFYPTFMRSTGIGWAMGIGRIGSVLGPLALGTLLKANWPLGAILDVLASMAVGAAVLFALMGRAATRRGRRAAMPLVDTEAEALR